MTQQFTSTDWRRLRALRDRFLADATQEYWTTGDLELYDATFAQRIGWKWDGVLAVLDRAGWRPASTRLVDWGCGSGIAGRAVADWSGIQEGAVHDQSLLAVNFALGKLRARGMAATILRQGERLPDGALLLISHVVGELLDDELLALAEFASGADEIIWVEPGSREISLRLARVHDILLERGHGMIAPCTHNGACPMGAQEKDWCHFFATPPSEIFQSAFWREFSLQMEIDMRALPFSFLASSKNAAPRWPQDAERQIGHPRVLKGHCELLCCGRAGLVVRGLQKRDEPELFRHLCREDLDGVFQWKFDPERPKRTAGGRLLDDLPSGEED